MLEKLNEKRELIEQAQEIAQDPAGHPIAQSLLNIIVEMEYAQLEAVGELTDALDVEAVDVQKGREDRREQLEAVLDAMTPGGRDLETMWFEDVASAHIESPERAQSYAGLETDEWESQLADWADVYRDHVEDAAAMSDRELASIHVDRRFGVSLTEFEANVVEFDRSEALETLLASNFEAVEHGIQTATATVQAQNQSESNAEADSA